MTCQKVVIIHKGEIAAEGSPESLGKSIQNAPQVEVEIKGPQESIVKVLSGLQGILKVNVLSQPSDETQTFILETQETDVRNEIASTVINNHWSLLTLKTREMSFEDVYLKILTKEESA